jgi:hypothetical protein
MMKNKLECFYHVSKFKDHNLVKENALKLIDGSNFDRVIQTNSETDITKTDWAYSSNFERPWIKFLSQTLFNHMLNVYEDLGYDGFTIHEMWFQQYQKNSQHGWHTHSANFTNVYYLELPKHSPKTQIVVPFNQKEIIEIDVEEGDILVFPSFVIHKAPKNLIDDRKTIISYNVNTTYSDNIYGKGL